MRRVRALVVVVVVSAVLLGSVPVTSAQTPSGNCRYFNQTGHWVCNEFLEFYDTRGGLEIFGYPLTEAFDDPRLGMRVQYFQRARMEWHPRNPEPYTVQLGLLVEELGYRFPPLPAGRIPSPNSLFHHYFPETKHVVSYAFLDYFREMGGLDIFGYPRSEFMYENGYIVQYFQRARMEWHPEAIYGPKMRLANLGEIHIERFGLPENYDSSPANAPDVVTKLDVSASVRYAITGRQGVQTVFVYVNDQRRRSVSGAAIKMVVHYQSGDQWYEFEPTNLSGFARRSFDILPSPPGKEIVIDVTVTYGNRTATTQTSFLPWW
jgi:hypothetical protein